MASKEKWLKAKKEKESEVKIVPLFIYVGDNVRSVRVERLVHENVCVVPFVVSSNIVTKAEIPKITYYYEEGHMMSPTHITSHITPVSKSGIEGLYDTAMGRAEEYLKSAGKDRFTVKDSECYYYNSVKGEAINMRGNDVPSSVAYLLGRIVGMLNIR